MAGENEKVEKVVHVRPLNANVCFLIVFFNWHNRAWLYHQKMKSSPNPNPNPMRLNKFSPTIAVYMYIRDVIWQK